MMDEYINIRKQIKRTQKNKPAPLKTNSINQSLINEDLELTQEENDLVVREVRRAFYPDDEAVCDCYDTMKRENGTGPIRLRTLNDIREDLYMLVLVGNFKKNLLKIHRREADNNDKAQQKLIADELKLNSANYPGYVAE